MATLTITTIPFRPSLLSLPPSPHSPHSPLTTTRKPFQYNGPTPPTPPHTTFSPPPPTPLPWVWQCHICKRTYRLATARRCLDDGHSFCAGEAVVTTKNTGASAKKGKTKRRCTNGRACASEFDYAGWKAWGEWRKGEWEGRRTLMGIGQEPRGNGGTDCEGHCDYPSECRWGKMVVVPSVAPPVLPVVTTPTTMQPVATSIEEMLGLDPSRDGLKSPTWPPSPTSPTFPGRRGDLSFWTALLHCAMARQQDKVSVKRTSDDVDVIMTDAIPDTTKAEVGLETVFEMDSEDLTFTIEKSLAPNHQHNSSDSDNSATPFCDIALSPTPLSLSRARSSLLCVKEEDEQGSCKGRANRSAVSSPECWWQVP